MKKTRNLLTSLCLSAIMAVQPIACYAVAEEQETYSYTFDTYVADIDNSGTFIGGLNARIVEYASTGKPFYKKGEKIRTVAEWTTSDTGHEYITCDNIRNDCYYYLEIDELPENYSYHGDGYVKKGTIGDYSTLNDEPFQIYLNNVPPEEQTEQETYSYTFDAYVVDVDNHNALVGGLEARLVEYEFDIDSIYCQAGKKLRTIAEWTTSDTEHEYITCEDVSPECVYVLEIDKLPEDYSYAGKDYVVRHDFGDDLPALPYNPYLIQLHNEPPYETWEDFPITKTVDWSVSFRDYTSMMTSDMPTEYIQGIDVEIARMQLDRGVNFKPVETIGEWNTTGMDSITFTTEETFNSLDDAIYFGFKFNHVPEEYEEALSYISFERMSDDGYYVYQKSAESVRERNSNFYFTWKKSGEEYITTAPTTSKPHTTTTTTAKAPVVNSSAGDANGDNKVDISDAVLIMQSLSNPDTYKLTPEAVLNADVVNKGDGVTPLDALAIQMIGIDLLKQSDLPVTSEHLNSLMK